MQRTLNASYSLLTLNDLRHRFEINLYQLIFLPLKTIFLRTHSYAKIV